MRGLERSLFLGGMIVAVGCTESHGDPPTQTASADAATPGEESSPEPSESSTREEATADAATLDAGRAPENEPEAACLPEGADCGLGLDESDTSECCPDLSCRVITYGMPTCITPAPPGAPCIYGEECASLICSEGLCRAEMCEDAHQGCSYDFDCCSGFCSSLGAYGPGECLARLAPGEPCVFDFWCQSGSCVDGQCE